MKITIKDLAHYQKTFSEAIKFPMSMKTAEAMEKFLKETDEVVKKAMDDFKYNEKKNELINDLNKEIDERFGKAVENNEVDATNKVDVEEMKKKIAQEINSTEAAEKEKKINDEFMAIEVEVNPIEYVLDEKLPGIFNISMRDDKSGVVIFKAE
jgi:hypothetical protein